MSAPKDKYYLSYDVAHRLLRYDAETGVFNWREKRAHTVLAGDVAGFLEAGGYWVIHICGRFYKAHRLAWLLTTGKWPKDQIDHINRKRADNRFVNLREATKSENQINSGMYRNNKTGYRHVSPHKQSGKFTATIKRNGKFKHIGVYTTALAASKAAQEELKSKMEKTNGAAAAV